MAGIGKYKGVGEFDMELPSPTTMMGMGGGGGKDSSKDINNNMIDDDKEPKGKEKVSDPSKREESNIAKMTYAPFKMKAAAFGNSPMLKNFGLGSSPTKQVGSSSFEQASQAAMEASMNKIKSQQAAVTSGVGDTSAIGDTTAPVSTDPVEQAKDANASVEAPTPEANAQKIDQLAMELEQTVNKNAKNKQSHALGTGKPLLAQGTGSKTAVAGGGGGVSKWFSDIRLKEKIQRTGTSHSGIPIYEFNYIGDNSRYSGAMAQDLLNTDAVSMHESGYYIVNYKNIDVDMHLIN
jgi:hypothetical protein